MQRSTTKIPLRRTLAALAATLLILIGPVSAASAHDVLTGSTPQDGQTLKTMPGVIELTFSNTPIAMGSQIIIEDAEGTDWSTGEIEIVDTAVTQPISPDAPPGKYTVTWRVVSSDSHPIEGIFSFTVASGGVGAGASDQQPQKAVQGEAQEQGEQKGGAFPFSLVLIMVGILAALVIIIAVLARHRLGKSGKGPAVSDRS